MAIATAGLIAVAGPSSASTYFVQDRIGSNNPFILPLGGQVVDGPTSKSTSYDHGTTSIEANENLANGTLQGHLHSEGERAIRSVSAAFGDRVTIVGGAGTTVDFNLRFDAVIDAVADVLGEIPMLLTGSSRFAVFDPSTGATAGNWTSKAFSLTGFPDQSLGKGLSSFGYHDGSGADNRQAAQGAIAHL